MRFFKTWLIFLLLSVNSQAFCLTITGSEADYAGSEIVFYSYIDPVSRSEKELFILKIDQNGDFNAEIKISEVVFAFADFGIYRGYLFLQPGQSITLHLPPKKEKSLAEQKNPYFKPFSTWLKADAISGDDLNKAISAFDARYNQLADKYFNQLYIRQSRTIFDTISTALEKEFGQIKNPVFNNHKLLKLKILEGDVHRQDRERIFEKMNLLSPSYLLHPAFIEALDAIFTNRLSFEVRSIRGAALKNAVTVKDLKYLKRFCEENYKTTEPISSIIMLKMLHDAFYSGDFPKSNVLAMMDSPYFMENGNITIRQFSVATLKKLKFLLPGSAAPPICLKTLSGENICTDRAGKNYRYILFADTEIPVCQEHLKYLKQMNEKFPGKIDLFLILYPADEDQIKNFIHKNQIPGIILIDEPREKIAREFGIKSYPSAILLDRNHKVVLAPARVPLDGFEQQFLSILQSDIINSLRKSQQ